MFLRQFLFVAAFSSAHNYLYALLSVSVCLLCLFAFFKFFICFGMGQICCQYLYKGSRKGKNGQRKILLHHSSHLKCSQACKQHANLLYCIYDKVVGGWLVRDSPIAVLCIFICNSYPYSCYCVIWLNCYTMFACACVYV